MTLIEVSPVHVINRYVYDVLRANGAIGPRTDYGNKTPIVPSQQVPEFNQLNKPYLVYGFSDDGTGDLPTIKSGVVSYAVYSVDDREIIKIVNTISNVFGRWDESARDLNNYIWNNLRFPNGNPRTNPKLAVFSDVRFYHTETALAEGPGPAESEGGRQAGVVIVRFSYRVIHDDLNTVPTAT